MEMYHNFFSRNYKHFTIDINYVKYWKLRFWWRDWVLFKKDPVKQRLWKLQIGPVRFTYWHKRA